MKDHVFRVECSLFQSNNGYCVSLESSRHARYGIIPTNYILTFCGISSCGTRSSPGSWTWPRKTDTLPAMGIFWAGSGQSWLCRAGLAPAGWRLHPGPRTDRRPSQKALSEKKVRFFVNIWLSFLSNNWQSINYKLRALNRGINKHILKCYRSKKYATERPHKTHPRSS